MHGFRAMQTILWENLGAQAQVHLLDVYDNCQTCVDVWMSCVVAARRDQNCSVKAKPSAKNGINGDDWGVQHHSNCYSRGPTEH